MTEAQQKLLDLAVELDAMCKRAGADYFLSRNTAFYAWRKKGFNENDVEFRVMMRPAAYKKFRAQFEKEKPADRYLEGPDSNTAFPEFAFFYGDRNTLHFDVRKYPGANEHGIAVRIDIMRSSRQNKIKSLYWRMLETGREHKLGVIQTKSPRREFVSKAAVSFLTFFMGKKGFSRYFCKGVMKYASADPGKRMFTKDMGGKRVFFPSSSVRGKFMREFEGIEFPMPADYKNYLAAVIGRGWTKAKPVGVRPGMYDVVNADLPYAEYVASLDISPDFTKKRREMYALQSKALKYEKSGLRNWMIALRTRNRFRVARRYEPLMPRLRELQDEGKYAAMAKILLSYRKYTVYYLGKGMPFYINDELLGMLVKTEQVLGRGDFAAKVLTSLPASKRVPVNLDEIRSAEAI